MILSPGLKPGSLQWEIEASPIFSKINRSLKPLFKLDKLTIKIIQWQLLKTTTRSKQPSCPLLLPASHPLHPCYVVNLYMNLVSWYPNTFEYVYRTPSGTDYKNPLTGLIVLIHMTTRQAVAHQRWVPSCFHSGL